MASRGVCPVWPIWPKRVHKDLAGRYSKIRLYLWRKPGRGSTSRCLICNLCPQLACLSQSLVKRRGLCQDGWKESTGRSRSPRHSWVCTLKRFAVSALRWSVIRAAPGRAANPISLQTQPNPGLHSFPYPSVVQLGPAQTFWAEPIGSSCRILCPAQANLHLPPRIINGGGHSLQSVAEQH